MLSLYLLISAELDVYNYSSMCLENSFYHVILAWLKYAQVPDTSRH